MITEKDIVDTLTVSVTESVTNVIRNTLAELVQNEVSKALSTALFEGEFHRGVNQEVFTGIENIFAEISSFKKRIGQSTSFSSNGLLDSSTSVLDSIITSTEKATLNILDYLDEMQMVIEEAKKSQKGEDGDGDRLSILDSIESIMTKILTELSFQDLTGQQIRIVINSLKRVEELAYEVYLMAEALRKSKEKSPDKDIEELKEEATVLVTHFKERPAAIDQNQVDSFFEEYGL
ncbi:MAG: protein phosphatase CheZ [Syntrophobacteraceae bacterium]|nr:protein phosphatase CheZ [Syntrophobacteraceae bacterium]